MSRQLRGTSVAEGARLLLVLAVPVVFALLR